MFMYYQDWPKTLTTKEIALANQLYSSANQHIQPIANQINIERNINSDIWQLLGKEGFLGITASKEHGGQNSNYTAQCLAMAALSSNSSSVGLSYAAHENLCINQLVRFANTNQANKYLPKLITGENIGALAISEKNAGSDAMAIDLEAKKTTQGYILKGKKMWITNAPYADTIIVYAKTKQTGSKSYLSAFIIDKNIKGWQVGKMPNKIGMLGSLTAELTFNSCLIPKENLLGEEHKGSHIMMSGLDYERLILAAGPIGIMENCLTITTNYMLKRKQFGKALSEFQLMQAKIANMYTQYKAAKSFLFDTAKACDSNQLNSTDCAACFLFAAEAATQVASQTIQSLGAVGYSTDYPAAQLLADAKLYEIGGGTTEIRRLLIGKNLLKQATIA